MFHVALFIHFVVALFGLTSGATDLATFTVTETASQFVSIANSLTVTATALTSNVTFAHSVVSPSILATLTETVSTGLTSNATVTVANATSVTANASGM